MSLNFQELEDSLNTAIANVPTFYPNLDTFLTSLMVSGCRPTELLDLSRWSGSGGEVFTLDTAKKNNNRTFNRSTFSTAFQSYIDNSYFPWSVVNYRQLSYQFNSIYAYPHASVLGKEISLYLFRHYYIKKLHRDGLTVQQIMAITGHLRSSVVNGYIYSEIIV